MKSVRFSGQKDFYLTLKSRVDERLKELNVSPKGSFAIIFKSLIILTGFFSCYYFLVFTELSLLHASGVLVLLSFFCTFIGFCIEHDGSHGSYSSNKIMNKLAASTLDLIGASSLFWKYKHNYLHHTFTNINEIDDDLDANPFLRLSPDQEKKPRHKFQSIYFPFIYGLFGGYWVYYTDFVKFFTGKIGEFQMPKMKLREKVYFILTKIFFITYTIIIPSFFHNILIVLLFNFIFLFLIGIILAMVFNLAHIVDTTKFYNTSQKVIDKEWAIFQVETTANFATKNWLLGWFIGGLNFQVEHHLFPKICHTNYPKINDILKKTCKEFNVDYHEEKSLTSAVINHIRFLHTLGNEELPAT